MEFDSIARNIFSHLSHCIHLFCICILFSFFFLTTLRCFLGPPSPPLSTLHSTVCHFIFFFFHFMFHSFYFFFYFFLSSGIYAKSLHSHLLLNGCIRAPSFLLLFFVLLSKINLGVCFTASV